MDISLTIKEEPQFIEMEVEEGDPIVPVLGSSMISDVGDFAKVDNNPFKSLLLPNIVMDRYLERPKKLKAELKRVAIDDHEWWLKTFNLNGNGIVKLWCAECEKESSGSSKDHTKVQIDNLFNNF